MSKGKKGLGLSLIAPPEQSQALQDFVADEPAPKPEAEVRPPKPRGKGIIWRGRWTRKLGVYVDPDVARKFDMICAGLGVSKSDAVEEAIKMWIEIEKEGGDL